MSEARLPFRFFTKSHCFNKGSELIHSLFLGQSKLLISSERGDQRISLSMGIISVAAPFAVAHMLDHPSSDLIAVDVSLNGLFVLVLVNE